VDLEGSRIFTRRVFRGVVSTSAEGGSGVCWGGGGWQGGAASKRDGGGGAWGGLGGGIGGGARKRGGVGGTGLRGGNVEVCRPKTFIGSQGSGEGAVKWGGIDGKVCFFWKEETNRSVLEGKEL